MHDLKGIVHRIVFIDVEIVKNFNGGQYGSPTFLKIYFYDSENEFINSDLKLHESV